MLLHFNFSPSNECEVISSCGFIVHFPDGYDARFSCVCWHSNIHFSEVSSLLPFLTDLFDHHISIYL